MFCNYCGEKILDNSKFCNKCGKQIENSNGSITFVREGHYYGVLVPVKVYMDGILVASVANASEATVPASIGKHKIMFDVWSGNGANDIEILPSNPNIKITFKLGAGAFTSKPQITKIENI